jgi:hypothetical protein
MSAFDPKPDIACRPLVGEVKKLDANFQDGGEQAELSLVGPLEEDIGEQIVVLEWRRHP